MTVNHGVLGSSPCSGAIARGLQERCRSGVDSTSVERNKSCSPKPFFGSLAQLVQSICLTSRGSAVRIRQLPLKTEDTSLSSDVFFCLYLFLWTSSQNRHKQKKQANACLLFWDLTEVRINRRLARASPSLMTCSSESHCTTFESVNSHERDKIADKATQLSGFCCIYATWEFTHKGADVQQASRTKYGFVCDFISEGTDGSRRRLSR